MKERIEKVLDAIRPNLQMDGGDVSLVDVKDGVVKVHLSGACSGCSMSTFTFQNVVERELKKAIPEIKSIVQV